MHEIYSYAYIIAIPIYMHLYPHTECVPFPEELHHYGLTIEILNKAFQCSQQSAANFNEDVPGKWSLHGIPNVEFYRKLHPFLKKWEQTRTANKVSLGRFYISIDKQLQERGSTPNNTYLFIEKVVLSDKSDTVLMPYASPAHIYTDNELQDINDQDFDPSLEIENIKGELICAQESFKKVSNEMKLLQKERDSAYQKLQNLDEKYKSIISDMLHEEELLVQKNDELLDELTVLKSTAGENAQLANFLDTKNGIIYNQSIRELYYKLLADQIPPGKIEGIIKSVMNCFIPSMNTNDLKLPREKCAGYMRREEMNTICSAQKAYTISECKSFHLNSDGTTKFQKKIGAVSVNGMVLCLKEVPDGSADSMIELVETELEKLRSIAYDLKL